MKARALITLAAVLSLAAVPAIASEYTKGKVKKVDMKANKVTIIHEELKNLDMPAMTMVFVTKDEAMLEKLKEGQSIEFVADRLNGKLTVLEVK
ncbi:MULTISPECIES: copper-binding protein [Nitratireductor]|uniref:Copper tolerance protein n=1 Tax=Nitratireductor basaltis TaxID=472175 RepID=A0A084U9H2_9HYPH|nr:copper-binding protein [Nitratireductor basaltis]KFB09608.1 Copper tolerance protein [Nitratireductor basaltis]